jgi:rifamycin polyketide synthase module 7/8
LKSNIGHTQAAAGVGGVIKVVQALRHGVMPATLHVAEPTTQVDWSAGAVELLTSAREWPRAGRPRRAGVSSFGISGTNAHLIIEEAPEEETADVPAPDFSSAVPLVLSARTAGSLAGQAERLAAFVERTGAPLADVARALVSGRAGLGERAVVVAENREEALTGLSALARGVTAAGVVTGSVGAPVRTVWVFPGQGSQWAGMGRELLDSSPVFASRIEECAAALGRWIDWSLVDVLRGEASPEFLERVDVVQPASFAVMVGLAAVWSSMGTRPDAVVGHSQGEIAAACVSGALSLDDAARVVALRSQAIATKLAGRGGMASVALPEVDAVTRLAPWADRVEVAAVNSPSSVVVAGDAQALDEALEALSADGVRVRRVAVDYASHTRHVEDIHETLLETLEVTAQAPVVPFYSTVTGDWIRDAGVVDGAYWYRNLRNQVGFGSAIAALMGQGYGAFVEISAHPVLVQPVTEIADDRDADVVVTGTLRRDDGGPRRLFASAAECFVRGVALDWTGVLPQASGRVELPTYAFDHQHYWLHATGTPADAASLGQVAVDHPLLGAVVRLPHADGLVFTSRWSVRSHAWLADHAVDGVVVVPGSALVELAVRAGDEAGCPVLDELVAGTPLVLPEEGGVCVQVAVGGPGETGTRTVEVYSRPDTGDTADGAEVWTRHAAGLLSATPVAGDRFDFAEWPPSGAQQVDVEDFYHDRGHVHGPAFQGLRALWRRGEEVFAEIAAPDGSAGEYGLHPALLDAALHPALPGGQDVRLPLDWHGLVLHAAGASALRVRLVPGEQDTVSLEAVDSTGTPVVSADAVVFRPVAADQLVAAGDHRDSLFRVEWTELPPVAAGPPPSWVAVTTADDVAAVADVPAVVLEVGEDSALALTSRVLDVVRAWLTGAGSDDARLVVVTRGAVPSGDGVVRDPAAAAVWGLVRSAQAENPDRIVLLDLDPATETDSVLGAVLATGEPQIAVRANTFSVPRLARVETADTPPVFGPEGTVLVSGAGVLGALVARHLVSRHGVRRLVLASRRGRDAEGMDDLLAELTGAEVAVVACDVSDRDQVAALLDEHRPAAVVHTAGVLDDGVLETLTPDRLASVFAPKVDAVRHLDELTRGLDLDAFVVFSSASGVLGSAGQGNYAAANAFLDATMASRRAEGLPGLSLAWGLWERATGMTAHLGGVDQARMSRGGVHPITAGEGMDLFDAALGTGEALLVPVKLDLREVRAAGAVPLLLRGLVRTGRRPATAATGDGGLVRRLAGLAPPEQEALLLDVVRDQVAVVLGHADASAVRAGMAFKEAGFDSLTSVELRNRLREATGLKLPATLVFDHPTPLVLARHLRDELGTGDPLSLVTAKIEDVESLIGGLRLDDAMRAGITLRLQGLVARCNGVPERTDVATVADQLESASADEVLDFIDEELGLI